MSKLTKKYIKKSESDSPDYPIKNDKDEPDKIYRLNYIGSKFQLMDWIIENIKSKTNFKSLENIKIGDLFAGTGIISYKLRKEGAIVISNDRELYSYYIIKAFTLTFYNENIEKIINLLNKELEEDKYKMEEVGFITKYYTPDGENERKFFTIDNGKRIDYLRKRIEDMFTSEEINENDYIFLLASLLIGADNVSNVPAVYGCFLKEFKSKALKILKLTPIHNLKNKDLCEYSKTFNNDVLDIEFLEKIKSLDLEIVYLDPPYNERQYSKNYFPLNIISKPPTELIDKDDDYLKGKTGIPSDCFISSFCKKGKIVEDSFDLLIKKLFENEKTKWIFLSYNSESLINRDKMIEIMSKYGKIDVIERDYKRFKSFEYNKDKSIKEYLFCLEKNL